MSKYIAKRVILDTMRECSGAGCSDFTFKGYYIHYQNRNVDSALFVCDECFERHYRSQCTLGSFNENDYIQNGMPDYSLGSKTFREFRRLFRKAVRCARIAVIVFSLLLITLFVIKEKPQLRSEFPTKTVHCEINSVHRSLDAVFQGFEGLFYRIKNVIKHDGGNKND